MTLLLVLGETHLRSPMIWELSVAAAFRLALRLVYTLVLKGETRVAFRTLAGLGR